MANIIKLLLDGIQAKLSKSALSDDVVSQLLPDFSNAPADSCPMVDYYGNMSWVPVLRKSDPEVNSSLNIVGHVFDSSSMMEVRITIDGNVENPIIAFEGDSSVPVRLRNVADPVVLFDVANKRYVDQNTPMFITFTGTTDGGDAACSATWDMISSAIAAGRPIAARYAWTLDDRTYYRDLFLGYDSSSLNGHYLHIDNLVDPTASFDQLEVVMSANLLEIVVSAA